jgi:predicted NUDIX family NTP pyrophosphohydrolase
MKRRCSPLGANSPKKRNMTPRDLSCPSENHGNLAARSSWAVEDDWDAALIRSNTFEMEWPPRSGRLRTFPEIDRAAWFAIADARRKILKGQAIFVDRLLEALAEGRASGTADGIR